MSSSSPGSAIAQRVIRLGPSSTSWQLAIALLSASLLVIVALFWEAASAAVQIWSKSGTFGHGFLIMPISGWLVWRQRRRLAAERPQPCLWAIPIIVLLSVGWFVARSAEVLVLQQFALITILQAFCLALLGPRLVKLLVFPLGYLLFSVPFGSFLILPLQELTAQSVVPLLRASGIPVYLEGLFFDIPSARFEVAKACSGIRYLISLTALGVLVAYVFFTSLWRRVLFVCLSVFISIMANSLRAYGIVMIAYWSDLEYAVGVDHLVFGWLFFGVLTSFVLALAWCFRESQPDLGVSRDRETTRVGKLPSSNRTHLAVGCIALAAASMGPVGLSLRQPTDLRCIDLDGSGPSVASPWQETAKDVHDWRPSFPGATGEIYRTYASGGREVIFYAVYYLEQRQGRELISENNRIFNSSVWQLVGLGETRVSNGGTTFTAETRNLRSATGYRLVWYSYWIDGAFTTNPLMAKILEAKSRLFRGVPVASVIAMSTSYNDVSSDAARTLHDFASHVEPLGELLRKNLVDPVEQKRQLGSQSCS